MLGIPKDSFSKNVNLVRSGDCDFGTFCFFVFQPSCFRVKLTTDAAYFLPREPPLEVWADMRDHCGPRRDSALLLHPCDEFEKESRFTGFIFLFSPGRYIVELYLGWGHRSRFVFGWFG
jgi:hypothetical protein